MFRYNINLVEKRRNGGNAKPNKFTKKLRESTEDNLGRRHQRANCFAFLEDILKLFICFISSGKNWKRIMVNYNSFSRS